MNKSFLNIVAVVLMGLSLVACGFTMPTYEGNGFSLKYPSDWSASTVDTTRLVTISHLNRASRTVDGVITVQGEPLNNNSIEGVLGNNESSLKAVYAGVESEKVTVSGQSGLMWSYSQASNDIVTTYRQVMFVQNNVIYTVTAAIQGANTDTGDIETAVKSVVIK